MSFRTIWVLGVEGVPARSAGSRRDLPRAPCRVLRCPPRRAALLEGLADVIHWRSGSRAASETAAGRRQLLGPYDHLLAVLPLEQHHLVGDLEPDLVHLESSVGGMSVEFQDGIPDPSAVQGSDCRRPRTGSDMPRILRPSERKDRRPEIPFCEPRRTRLHPGTDERSVSPPRAQGHELGQPLSAAIDEFSITPQQLVELRKVSAR